LTSNIGGAARNTGSSAKQKKDGQGRSLSFVFLHDKLTTFAQVFKIDNVDVNVLGVIEDEL
jgi:hypothetical protein